MEASGRRWTRWIAVAVGASTFLAVAGIAAAHLTSESASTTIAPQEDGIATAKCGSGSEAVAGGFAAPGLDPTAETGPAILSYASLRTADGKWQARGHNFNNPTPAPKVDAGSGPLVAYAYCDKHDPSVTVRSRATMVAAQGNASLTPKCRRGSEAVSGGLESDAPQADGLTPYAYMSQRVGNRGWKVAVHNLASDPHAVAAFAYCEKHGPNLVTRTASKDFGVHPTATATAKCPKGASMFSGGYKSTFSHSATAFDYGLPYTSKRSAGDKWKVAAIRVVINTAGTGAAETAIAYCAT
jgi:hypothetical protein